MNATTHTERDNTMLTLHVYKNPLFANCSNDGITKNANRLTVVNVGGEKAYHFADAPPVLLKERCGNPILVPAELNDDNQWVEIDESAGPMAGGTFAATCDSGFREAVENLIGHGWYGAVAVHDRYESWEQYRRLSTD